MKIKMTSSPRIEHILVVQGQNVYIYVCVFLLIHRYGTWYTNAYGADGFQYMRGYDASYDAFYTDGPTGQLISE